jgi:hypothetical protein
MMRAVLVVLFVALVSSQFQDPITQQPPMVFPLFTQTRDGLGSYRNNAIYDEEFSPINNQIAIYIGDHLVGPGGVFPFLENPRTDRGWYNVTKVSPNANTNVKPGDRVFIRPDLVLPGIATGGCPFNQIVLINPRLIQPELFDPDPANVINPPAGGLHPPINGIINNWANLGNPSFVETLRTQAHCVWDASTIIAKISPTTQLDQLNRARQVTPGQNNLNP